jgi:hypothetical protein
MLRWEEIPAREFFDPLWERLPCLGGPEAAGKAPITVEHQMPPAAEAQTQELAPKQAQHRHVLGIYKGVT